MISQSKKIAELRLLVGYLGEHKDAAWWSSQFFGPSTATFLTPIFTRTLLLAQYQGVCAAAARQHDEHIGVGRTFHLYRLPEVEEQGATAYVAHADHEPKLRALIASRETALGHLQQMGTSAVSAGVGPVSLGDTAGALDEQLAQMAALYAKAFQQGEKTYPYLREAQ